MHDHLMQRLPGCCTCTCMLAALKMKFDIAIMLHPSLLHSTPLGLGALHGTKPAFGKGDEQVGLLLQVSSGQHSRPATTWRGCMTFLNGRTILRQPMMASTTTSTRTSTGKILLHHLTLLSCPVQMLQSWLAVSLAHLTVCPCSMYLLLPMALPTACRDVT